jgi:hypothetical protein
MNNTKSFSIVLFLVYQYSYVYDLEYGSYVMNLAYELEYSSYVMNLAYRTLCLISHTTYMIRIRAKSRWWFVVRSGLPVSYARRSVGSGFRGNTDSFFIHGYGARVYGNL